MKNCGNCKKISSCNSLLEAYSDRGIEEIQMFWNKECDEECYEVRENGVNNIDTLIFSIPGENDIIDHNCFNCANVTMCNDYIQASQEMTEQEFDFECEKECTNGNWGSDNEYNHDFQDDTEYEDQPIPFDTSDQEGEFRDHYLIESFYENYSSSTVEPIEDTDTDLPFDL